jgi:hypothetical protein
MNIHVVFSAFTNVKGEFWKHLVQSLIYSCPLPIKLKTNKILQSHMHSILYARNLLSHAKRRTQIELFEKGVVTEILVFIEVKLG